MWLHQVYVYTEFLKTKLKVSEGIQVNFVCMRVMQSFTDLSVFFFLLNPFSLDTCEQKKPIPTCFMCMHTVLNGNRKYHSSILKISLVVDKVPNIQVDNFFINYKLDRNNLEGRKCPFIIGHPCQGRVTNNITWKLQ